MTRDLVDSEQTRLTVELLSTATAALARTRDLPGLAAALAEVASRLVATEYFSVYFLDPETGTLTLPFARGFSAEEQREALRTAMDRHPGRVLRTGDTIHVPDVAADGQRNSQDSRRSFVIRSRLWMPVSHDDRNVGAIGLASGKTHTFTPIHITVLGFICRLAGVIYRDLADEAALRRQLELVRRHEIELRRLSSPIIEVGRGILALPLFGALDHPRLALVTERCLAAIAARQARALIVDMTGVEQIGDDISAPLLRLCAAVALLGCRVALSGISSSAAAQLSALPGAASLRSFGTIEQALSAFGGPL